MTSESKPRVIQAENGSLVGVIWFIFIGDCLGEDIYSGAPSYTTRKLFTLVDQLLSYDVDFYMEGHAEQPASRQQMAADLSLLKTIGGEVDRIGQNRAAILSTLPAMMGMP
jgi:hypothetical protein